MRAQLREPTRRLPIDHHSAVQVAADQARLLAGRCGMTGALPEKAAVIASELASNIDKYARDGALYLQPNPLDAAVDIIAVDRGPGIPDIGLSLTDGFSTARTLGAGLGAVSRIATGFTVRSDAAHGTLVHARLAPPLDGPPPMADVGALCLTAAGARDCGDGYAVTSHGQFRTALVLDAADHGEQAAEATQRALRTFHAHAEAPLADILQALHRALRHTGGAAAAVLRVHADHAEHCGVGDITVTTHTAHGVHQQYNGQAGSVGHDTPHPRVQTVDLTAATTLTAHTNGIDHRWAGAATPFQLRLPPGLLAAQLAHSHRRYRDDATVLVLGSSQGDA